MSNSFKFKISRKNKMLIAWSVLITLSIIYFFFQWYSYKRHGYITDYAVNVYLNEREANIREKQALVVETLAINNLNINKYDEIEKLINDFLSNSINEEMLQKEAKKNIVENNMPIFINDVKKLNKNIEVRNLLTNDLVEILNKGENNRGDKKKNIEQLLNIKIK